MKQSAKRIGIIGGGAAGLIAAITAAREGCNVTVFEKESRAGKKILVSGNGRCNISNTHLHPGDYFGSHADFVSFALNTFDFHHFKKFCNSIGLHLHIHQDGRVYPLSNEAKSVHTLLLREATLLHVNLLTECRVQTLSKEPQGFVITTSEAIYDAFDAVLIATGSQAAEQLGATDDGYRLAQALGHPTITPYPCLVGLHLNSTLHSKLSGVKVYAELTLLINHQKMQHVTGDVLFTKYGISGFATLDISQAASLALHEHQHVAIEINLLPHLSTQELGSRLAKFATQLREHTVLNLLEGMVSTKVAPLLLQESNINAALTCDALNTKQIKKILHTMTQWRFEVSDTHGFKHAEVSGGGVCTEQIDPKTMHSRLHKGLYFAGEVLDIVGKRGGYNLHFAWASGYLAATAMIRNES